MGRVEFRRPYPPLQAPRLCPHSNQEGCKGGDSVSSVLALLCCCCCGSDSEDCAGGGAEGVSASGSDGFPPVSTEMAREAMRNVAGSVTGAAVGVRLRPRKGAGDRHRGKARSPRAAEMRRKT